MRADGSAEPSGSPWRASMVLKQRSTLQLLSLLGLASCNGTTLAPDNSKTDVSKIVYAVRPHTVPDASATVTTVDVAGGMSQVMDYGRYEPGGKLEVLDLRTNIAQNMIAD